MTPAWHRKAMDPLTRSLRLADPDEVTTRPRWIRHVRDRQLGILRERAFGRSSSVRK